MKTRNSIIAVLAAAAVVAAGCGGASDETGGGGDAAASSGDGSKGTLSLVAYSTPRSSTTRSSPTSRRRPRARALAFKTSYGASGDQSRAVEAGLQADVVSFSTEPDMTRLVDAGQVAPTGTRRRNEGLVTTSVVSFVVRKGNPKNIKTWDDLLKPGVKVLTPNPFTSGAAKWNLLAAYGQASDGGKNQQAGLDYVRKLITEHVPVQDKSGREALQNFIGGDADVLLSYEYEATTAKKKGEEVDYVIARRHDQDQHRHRDDEGRAAGGPDVPRLRALGAGAGALRRAGATARSTRRSWRRTRRTFPDPPGLFTIEDLGGWEKVNDEFFDVESGSIAKIEEDAGVSTAK